MATRAKSVSGRKRGSAAQLEPERRYGGQRVTDVVQDSGVSGKPPDIYCYDWPILAEEVLIAPLRCVDRGTKPGSRSSR
ncbi:MAG TPA: hypothetical protein P5528_09410 [Steroidobacteraceae bacterium]|nr:hypothetical protein [Steroidobacteraceae bacterium]HRX89649.1 hypothetical protein [Steroidobacteraceae bacterium]